MSERRSSAQHMHSYINKTSAKRPVVNANKWPMNFEKTQTYGDSLIISELLKENVLHYRPFIIQIYNQNRWISYGSLVMQIYNEMNLL